LGNAGSGVVTTPPPKNITHFESCGTHARLVWLTMSYSSAAWTPGFDAVHVDRFGIGFVRAERGRPSAPSPAKYMRLPCITPA
jgi:hypothetical protein